MRLEVYVHLTVAVKIGGALATSAPHTPSRHEGLLFRAVLHLCNPILLPYNTSTGHCEFTNNAKHEDYRTGVFCVKLQSAGTVECFSERKKKELLCNANTDFTILADPGNCSKEREGTCL